MEFLKSPAVNIPISGIGIGPVHKRDVIQANLMLEKRKEYATILALDVKVTPEAQELANRTGMKILCADVIYHLFDQFKAYLDELKEEKKEAAREAIFSRVLKIVPNCIFNKDPLVLGVDVLEGIAKIVGISPEEQPKVYGRHFGIDNVLVSHISRQSIDVLKASYREDLSTDDWKLVLKLKSIFKIV